MSNIAVKVEGISKKYQIGSMASGTLRETLGNKWRSIKGKKNTGTEDFWALNDISFEVKKGEAIGIIGRNGAGKSTLLKILSKITYPTTGRIEIEGRISSLLEVGTGFHPELTGRENIFLNGTILGMSRKEVKLKFDEIVDFSGVEKFLDTPVKRYSSGMYVRLAFSVAAYLNPEILIIDEVLAVGDAEFQKKCLGKMDDVAKKGRTVIFVSHNMQAINMLCNKAMMITEGQLIANSYDVPSIIRKYNDEYESTSLHWIGNEGDENVRLLATKIGKQKDVYYSDEEIQITISYQVLQKISNLVIGFHLKSQYGYEIAYTIKGDFSSDNQTYNKEGRYTEVFTIPANSLTKGTYYIKIDLGIHDVKFITRGIGDLSFFVMNRGNYGCRYPVQDIKGYNSLFRPNWHSKTEYES